MQIDYTESRKTQINQKCNSQWYYKPTTNVLSKPKKKTYSVFKHKKDS